MCNIRGLVLGLIVVSLSFNVYGNVYYVSPNGDDLSPGSEAKPFLTIQKGINAAKDGTVENYDTVRVLSGVYETNPIYLNKDNQEIYFEKGVLLLAKSNKKNHGKYSSFYSPTACLFKAVDRKNISIIAYGATFKMRKEEYVKLKGEWRTVISLAGCENIKIEGATLKDSGGDGIYIGSNSKHKSCKMIHVKDVICDNNSRNAISVISVDGLLIENCILKNTKGRPPEDGLDIEPNSGYDKLKNIVVKDTTIMSNNSFAVQLQLNKLRPDKESPDVPVIDILFESVRITDGKGVYVSYLGDSGPDGLIKFKDMLVDGTSFGTWIGKSSSRVNLIFENCIWKDIKNEYFYDVNVPIRIFSNGHNTKKPGGVQFKDCQIFDVFNRPIIDFSKHDKDSMYEIHGDIYVSDGNKKEKMYEWRGAELHNVDLLIHRGLAPFAESIDYQKYGASLIHEEDQYPNAIE